MKKYLLLLVILPLLIGPMATFAQDSNASTIAQLQVQIAALQRQLEELKIAIAHSNTASGVPSVTASTGTSASGNTTVGGTTAVSFDNNTANDDIVQLSNLRIYTISASTTNEAIITAAYDYGVQCQKFSDKSSARGVAFACPLYNSQLYTIRVTNGTQLFLRNRVRVQLSDFAVGDRINVYGFMDRANLGIDALIIRNLDNPKQHTYLQLNNVEVIELPAGGLPTTFVVARKSPSPCFDYGTAGGSGTPFPCPLSLEGTSALLAPIKGDIAVRQITYKILVSANTKIVNRERVSMSLADIAKGDHLNIYGLQVDSTGTIEALVIRDLSQPVQTSRATIRAMVVNAELNCAQQDPSTSVGTPLCGLIYNATVRLYKNIARIAEETTRNGVAVFEGVEPGLYSLDAFAPGYLSTGAQSVVVEKGDYSVVIRLKKTAVLPPTTSAPTAAPTNSIGY